MEERRVCTWRSCASVSASIAFVGRRDFLTAIRAGASSDQGRSRGRWHGRPVLRACLQVPAFARPFPQLRLAREPRNRRLGIPEWQLEVAMALPTSVIDDLVADSRRFYTAEAKPSPQPVRGTEWVDRLLQQYRHCRDAHPRLEKISLLRRCGLWGPRP